MRYLLHKIIFVLLVMSLCFSTSCGGGGGGGSSSHFYSGNYRFTMMVLSDTCFGVGSTSKPYSSVLSVNQDGKNITAVDVGREQFQFSGKENSLGGFTVSYKEGFTEETYDISNFYNGVGDITHTDTMNFSTGESCEIFSAGTVYKIDESSPETAPDDNFISDFSGKWAGNLTLRADECPGAGHDKNKKYVINVEQAGTAVKVNDGEYVTKGDLYPDYSGFYSHASDSTLYSNGGFWWNVSHRLKRQDDGTYNLQVSITTKVQDGMGSEQCNIKYLGTVTRQ